MSIKVPMDPNLYAAAIKVMDAIEEKLLVAANKRSPQYEEELLGLRLAEAYRDWTSAVVTAYVSQDQGLVGDSSVDDGSSEESNRSTEAELKPTGKTKTATKRKRHPWDEKSSVPKRGHYR